MTCPGPSHLRTARSRGHRSGRRLAGLADFPDLHCQPRATSPRTGAYAQVDMIVGQGSVNVHDQAGNENKPGVFRGDDSRPQIVV
ncbi:hypothetical protein Psuf_063340 [Phytohabitans suffuscus]|uniref:Uncharacterized protein n=1 Tax=Phytohabitans suffuscus TaxID=624315 RepID=A0A6F8YT62_9ACTN|nr:hypothetical protein Psuf_063340 [Phytohabitans suffuscus]